MRQMGKRTRYWDVIVTMDPLIGRHGYKGKHVCLLLKTII